MYQYIISILKQSNHAQKYFHTQQLYYPYEEVKLSTIYSFESSPP